MAKLTSARCETCNKQFKYYPSEQVGRFCSRKCIVLGPNSGSFKSRGRCEERACSFCGESFATYLSENKRYCSLKCYANGADIVEHLGEYAKRGDSPSYGAIHKRLLNDFGKAKKCEICGSIDNCDWANVDQLVSRLKCPRYTTKPSDYYQLCRSCHKLWDNGSASFNLYGLRRGQG